MTTIAVCIDRASDAIGFHDGGVGHKSSDLLFLGATQHNIEESGMAAG